MVLTIHHNRNFTKCSGLNCILHLLIEWSSLYFLYLNFSLMFFTSFSFTNTLIMLVDMVFDGIGNIKNGIIIIIIITNAKDDLCIFGKSWWWNIRFHRNVNSQCLLLASGHDIMKFKTLKIYGSIQLSKPKTGMCGMWKFNCYPNHSTIYLQYYIPTFWI